MGLLNISLKLKFQHSLFPTVMMVMFHSDCVGLIIYPRSQLKDKMFNVSSQNSSHSQHSLPLPKVAAS